MGEDRNTRGFKVLVMLCFLNKAVGTRVISFQCY